MDFLQCHPTCGSSCSMGRVLCSSLICGSTPQQAEGISGSRAREPFCIWLHQAVQHPSSVWHILCRYGREERQPLPCRANHPPTRAFGTVREEPSAHFLGLFVMSHWLGDVWIQIWDISVVLPFSLFRLENHVCLSRGVQVAGAAWRVATRIVAGVGDLMQRTGDVHTGRVTLCAVCTWRRGAQISWLSLKTNVDSLSVVWPQNDWDDFLRFGLKTGGDGFSRFDLKTGGGGFPGLGLKIDSYSFLVWASKPSKLRFVDCASKPTGGCDDVGHASRSSSLLHVEASRARVS
jgi:hypothetical protein